MNSSRALFLFVVLGALVMGGCAITPPIVLGRQDLPPMTRRSAVIVVPRELKDNFDPDDDLNSTMETVLLIGEPKTEWLKEKGGRLTLGNPEGKWMGIYNAEGIHPKEWKMEKRTKNKVLVRGHVHFSETPIVGAIAVHLVAPAKVVENVDLRLEVRFEGSMSSKR